MPVYIFLSAVCHVNSGLPVYRLERLVCTFIIVKHFAVGFFITLALTPLELEKISDKTKHWPTFLLVNMVKK